MKNFLFAVAMIGLTSVANAGTRFNQYPTVGGVAVNNLCDAGATFKTLSPVKVCTKWKNNPKAGTTLYHGNEWTCLASATKVAKISKKYVVSTCNEPNPATHGNIEFDFPTTCTQSQTTKSYGNTFTVPVYENMGEAGLVVVGTFKHTIPACN
jgi:hypothetical protein